MATNHSKVTGPNTAGDHVVPNRWTAKRIARITSVNGTT